MNDSTNFIATGIIITIVVGLVFAFIYGTGRSEYVECVKWEKQASEFSGYFITSWQKDQCDAHGIRIDAPVVTR